MNLKTTNALAKAVAVAIIAVIVIAIWVFVGFVRTWTNDNSGFVSAIGLFLIVPFAIWTARLLERRQREAKARSALEILSFELWHNLNYVSQIEQSYKNNFEWFEKENPTGVHVPHFGPRISILDKFISIDNLTGLSIVRRSRVLEIYAQLCIINEEFPRWRNILSNQDVLNDRDTYILLSATLLGVIDVAMRNMVWLWVSILPEIGREIPIPQIQAVTQTITGLIARGRMLHPTYKSSRLSTATPSLTTNDVIICWQNDTPDSTVEIVELDTIGALHDTWIPAAGGG